MTEIVDLINKYGFPIVAAGGMFYIIWHVWTRVTETIEPILDETKSTLIGLIDRVRMLDNDLIRLQQKVNVVLELKKQSHDKQQS